MAIVQAGNQFTVEDIHRTAGRLATMVRDAVLDSDQFRIQLESWPDADLMAMGLTQEEVNAIKGFFVGDIPNIKNLVTQSTWIKQLLGLG